VQVVDGLRPRVGDLDLHIVEPVVILPVLQPLRPLDLHLNRQVLRDFIEHLPLPLRFFLRPAGRQPEGEDKRKQGEDEEREEIFAAEDRA
jgi:hypothetical protein